MATSPYPRFQPCAVLSVPPPCASVPRTVCGGFPKHAGAATEVSTGRHEYVLGCEGIFHRLYASFGEQYAITQGKDASLTKYFPIDKSIGGWHAGASYLQNSRVGDALSPVNRNPGCDGASLQCRGGYAQQADFGRMLPTSQAHQSTRSSMDLASIGSSALDLFHASREVMCSAARSVAYQHVVPRRAHAMKTRANFGHQNSGAGSAGCRQVCCGVRLPAGLPALDPLSTSSGVDRTRGYVGLTARSQHGASTSAACIGELPRAGIKPGLDVDLSDSHLPTTDSGACTPGQVQRAVICFGRAGSQDPAVCRWAA